MTTAVNIEMASGKVVGDTRTDFAGAVSSLEDGWYQVAIQPVKKGYTATRYKYYFAHVLHTILMTCGHFFKVVEGETSRPARSTEEIHQVFRLRYNSVAILTPFGVYQTANSTTGLSDRDFIQKYEEAIMIEFQEAPFGCEFMGREEWALYMKNGKKHKEIR